MSSFFFFRSFSANEIFPSFSVNGILGLFLCEECELVLKQIGFISTPQFVGPGFAQVADGIVEKWKRCHCDPDQRDCYYSDAFPNTFSEEE